MVTSRAGRMYETLEDGDGLATETGQRTRAQGTGVEQACAATGFGQFDGNAVFWQGLPVGYVIRQKSKGRGGRSCAA